METNKFTPIEAKTQADYDVIAGAFRQSREGMQWAEVEREIAALPAGATMLDVGCGMGRLYESVRNHGLSYTGIDISERQLSEARRLHPEADFIQGSMLQLPFAAASFDAVFSVAALHHLLTKEERQKALSEAVRVLKPGGKLVITVMGLWQKKYWSLFFQKREGLKTLDAESKRAVKWNDIFLPWTWKVDEPRYRYYHAFRKSELVALMHELPVSIEQIGYASRGKRSRAWKGMNLVVVARKNV